MLIVALYISYLPCVKAIHIFETFNFFYAQRRAVVVRTSTSALRIRIYLLLMNCKLALRRNLHYAGFRQYSTHVTVVRTYASPWYDYDATYELLGFYACVAKTSQNVQHHPSQFCCAADTIACNPHSNDIQRFRRAAHTRMEGTTADTTMR